MSDIKELIASKLRPIGDAIREKDGSTELIPIDDMPQAIRNIQGGGGGGIVEVTELPEVGEEDVVYKLVKQGGTAVPNNGYVENVYFNTSKDYESYYNLFEKIDYIDYLGSLVYPVLFNPDVYMLYIKKTIIDGVVSYGIYYQNLSDGSHHPSAPIIVHDGNLEIWSPDFIERGSYVEVNNNVIDNLQGINIGLQNDLLTDFISIGQSFGSNTEEYFVYEKLPPLAVPTSGTVSKVYINPIYTAEEMRAIIEKYATVELQGLYVYPIAVDINTGKLLCMLTNRNRFYIIGVLIYDGSLFTVDSSSRLYYEGLDKHEAVFNENGLELNWTTILNADGLPIGSKNSEISNLISITPDFSGTGQFKQISGGIKQVSELPAKGNSNYVYKVQGVPTAIPYMNVEGVGVVSLIEFALQEETYVEIVDIVESVDKLPTSNIIETTEHEMYGYYVRNDNYYVYGSFGDDGAKIWVTISALIGLPFVGEITNVSEITELNSVYALVSGGDSADYYIYEKGEPTQVPNSGLIENLYFNTSLSVEEVDNILSQLTYDTDGYAYVVGAYEKGSSYGDIIIVEANAFTQGQIPSGYIIGHMHDTTNMASTDFIYVSNQGLVDLALTLGINTKVGWNMETLSLNQEFIGEYGTENDKLINVVSTTPYPHWTEISGGGATVKATPIAVPNSGYVEKVYLNKSLSFDKVNALVEKANTFMDNDSDVLKWNIIVGTADNKKCLNTSRLSDDDGTTYNAIWFIDATSGISKFTTVWSERNYTSSDGTSSWKKGWNIEEDYIEINSNAEPTSTDDFGTHNHGKYNDQLTELFSANGTFVSEMKLDGDYDGTPITVSNKYVKKTVVPNEGYVERVYFNTSLSVEEVKAILEKFHTYVDVDTLDNAMWLINIDDFNNSGVTPEKLYWIMPSRDTGDYAILNALAQVIFKSNSSKWAGGDFVGWNPEFITAEKPYLEINSQVFPIVTENGKEIKIGGFNDKIIDLFSLTPFEETIYDSVEVDIKEMLEEKKLPLEIKVNVESQEPNLQEKEITENGEYVADEGYDGFSKVTVNVESSGSSVSPMKLLLDGRKSADNLFNGFSGESIDDIISYSDTENVTSMSSMFNNCKALTTIPQLDTSKVTNMGSIFKNCSVLTEIPQLDTSNVTNMNSMFNNCKALTTIPQLDTSKVTNMGYMFNNCYKLTAVSQLDTSNVTNAQSMFDGCSALTAIPQLDTSKVTSMNDMFNSCSVLKTIPQINMIKVKSDSYASNMLLNCLALTNLTLLNIKVNLQVGSGDGTGSWDWGHLLTLDSLINTVKELINVGSARTLTMGSANLEKIASTYVKFTDSSVTSIPTNEKGDVVVCELTDEGAMLLKDYALLKNWTLA